MGVWLFAGRCPIGSGWAALELSFADQAEVMGGGAVETEMAVKIFPRAMPRALVVGEADEGEGGDVAGVTLSVRVGGGGGGSGAGETLHPKLLSLSPQSLTPNPKLKTLSQKS